MSHVTKVTKTSNGGEEETNEYQNEEEKKEEETTETVKNPRGYTHDELERFELAYQRSGRNATAAAIEVRPHLASRPVLSRKVGERMLAKLDAEAADMVMALRREGVGSETVAKKIFDLLNAKKIIKTFSRSGDVTITEEDNYTFIDRGITHALKIGIGGGYKAEEIRQSGVVGHAHFSLGEFFAKAAEAEKTMESSMSPQEYQERVLKLLNEAKQNGD